MKQMTARICGSMTFLQMPIGHQWPISITRRSSLMRHLLPRQSGQATANVSRMKRLTHAIQ
jgi:hypothetical protein